MLRFARNDGVAIESSFTLLLAAFALLLSSLAAAQSAQVGADKRIRPTERLQVEHLHYRPARWEEELVTEYENQPRNEGGLVFLYLRNVTDEPIDLRFWRVNGEDESYWRLNHLTAWDRVYDRRVAPGATTVLEINGLTEDFAPGNDFKFAYVGNNWAPVCAFDSELNENPLRISYLAMRDDLRTLTVHVRESSGARARDLELEIPGREIESVAWVGESLRNGAAIAQVKLAQPMAPSELLIVRVANGEAEAWAHRRAHADYFPIGIWNSNPKNWAAWHQHHIDTMVAGGSAGDSFYSEAVPKYGFRNMVHSGVPTQVDRVRAVKDRPSLACWMIQDEPDWSIASNIMLHEDNAIRQYDRSKPTFITLCRNIKFMEYGTIADIPCQDHYSVTAPSSSVWPKPYGTRLEETGYYTRDLKYATEPKPIWVWTQGIADWGQRPKRPVPTPDELAVQLLQNLGYGAKGILWFNYDDEMDERFPDAMDAVQAWGRVMRMLREDLLHGDVIDLDIEAPEAIDVLPIVSRDALVLFVTNKDYEIHPEAYPFETQEDVSITFEAPPWLAGQPAWSVGPDGPNRWTETEQKGAEVSLRLDKLKAVRVLVIADEAQVESYRAEYDAARAQEMAEE